LHCKINFITFYIVIHACQKKLIKKNGLFTKLSTDEKALMLNITILTSNQKNLSHPTKTMSHDLKISPRHVVKMTETRRPQDWSP
jgi:hypothetical protein